MTTRLGVAELLPDFVDGFLLERFDLLLQFANFIKCVSFSCHKRATLVQQCYGVK